MTEENKNKDYEFVLLERLESKVDLLVEKVEKIDSLETKVDSLIDDMDYVKSNLVDNRDRFKEINETAENHEKRLIKLEKMTLAKG